MKEFLCKNIEYSLLFSFILGCFCGFILLYFDLINLSSSTKEISITSKPYDANSSTDNDTDTLAVSEPCDLQVDVSGAVTTPGVYCLAKGGLVVDAVNKAMGFTRNYAKEFVARKINMAKQLENSEKVYIPFQKDLRCDYIDFLPQATLEDSLGISVSTEGCVSVNSGTLADLTSLSGVGESTAIKIMDGRPYKKLEDLKEVGGIGEKTYENLVEYICL